MRGMLALACATALSSAAHAAITIDAADPQFQARTERALAVLAASHDAAIRRLHDAARDTSQDIVIRPITDDRATWHADGDRSRSHADPADGRPKRGGRDTPTGTIIFLNPESVDPERPRWTSGVLVHELVHAVDLAYGRYHAELEIRERRAVFMQNLWRDRYDRKLRKDYHDQFKTRDYQHSRRDGNVDAVVDHIFSRADLPQRKRPWWVMDFDGHEPDPELVALIGFAIYGLATLNLIAFVVLRRQDRKGRADPSPPALLSDPLTPAHLAALNDSLALKAAWSPMAHSKDRFRTYDLSEPAPGRLEFRINPMKVRMDWTIFFFLLGTILTCAPFVVKGVGENDLILIVLTLLLPAGLLLAVLGYIASMWLSRGPRVFDRASGLFWIGKQPANAATSDKSCRLADIHALQLLKHQRRGKYVAFWMHELNLVRKDGQRIHVVRHGDREALLADAVRLSRTLGLKLWDTGQPT